MDYKNKYLKYKNKYLQLKNYNQIGGGKKIFDLSKKYPEYKKGELQNNLLQFIKNFGYKIKIKYNNINIDVIIEEKTLPNKTKFYSMIYNIPKRTSNLYPFIIDFIDRYTMEKNNNSYISNINKTKNISGSEMVKLCLEINKILGVNKTSLGDGTSVICDKNKENMDLSFIKLIEKGMTFYMKFGFDFEFENKSDVFLYYRYTDKKEFIKELNRVLDNIRKIKTKDLIKEYNETLNLITKIIQENYKNTFEIIKEDSYHNIRNNIYYVENPKDKINEIITECKEVLDILHKYKNEKYFYKIMVKIFNDECDKYLILLKYIVDNLRYQIIYGNKKITRDYLKNFRLLYICRGAFWFTYNF